MTDEHDNTERPPPDELLDAIADLDTEQTLTGAGDSHAAMVGHDTRILLYAAHFADLHSADARQVLGRSLPGMERARQLGGAGTPKVLEFAPAEFGGQIERSPWSTRRLIADALDIRHRLPLLWARVCAREVKVWVARRIAQESRHLSAKAAGLVDRRVAPWADSLPWGRLETLLQAAVIEADPDLEAAKVRTTSLDQFVRIGRANDHGFKTVYIRTTAPAAIWFDATIARIADALKALGDTDLEDLRRAKAVGVVANPQQALQLFDAHARLVGVDPQSAPARSSPDPPDGSTDTEGSTCPACAGTGTVDDPTEVVRADSIRFDAGRLLPPATLYVHVHQDSFERDARGVARFEGLGPISLDQAREFLGPHCQVTVKPVIDLANMAPVDAYEIPDRFREAVHLRSPADVFPYANTLLTTLDVDHTEPWLPQPDGVAGQIPQTRMDNLGPLNRLHHRIKTHGGWAVRQPFSGIFIWRSPHGRYFLVDHTGTRRLGGTG